MESRIRFLLLGLSCCLMGGCASLHWPWHHKAAPVTAPVTASNDDDNAVPPVVIEPEVDRRKITVPKIKAHDSELGVNFGIMSIEDFDTGPVSGLRYDYHLTEDYFFEANYGRAKGGKTSYEELSGNVQLLTDAERQFTYYNVSLGYNFLPGEVFIGRNFAMTSAFYILGGFGGTDFAGDTKFTVNFGAGYRVVPVDWLAIHVQVQDHVFQSSVLGSTKLTNNLEALIGTTVFF